MLQASAEALLKTVCDFKDTEDNKDGAESIKALNDAILAFGNSVSQDHLNSFEMTTSDQAYLSTYKGCSSATIMLQTLTNLDNGDGDRLINQLIELLADPSESTQLANLISQYLYAQKIRSIFLAMIQALEATKEAAKTLLKLNCLSDSAKEKLCTQIIETYQQASLIISIPKSLIDRDRLNLTAPLYVGNNEENISEHINPVLTKAYAALIKLQKDYKSIHKEHWFIELFSLSLMPYQSDDELREKASSVMGDIQSFWEENYKKTKEVSISKDDLATIQQILARSIPPAQPDPCHPFLGGDSPVITPGEEFICPRMSQQLRLLTSPEPEEKIYKVREQSTKLALKLTEILRDEQKQCYEHYEKVKKQDRIIHDETMTRHTIEIDELNVEYEAEIKRINDDIEKDVNKKIIDSKDTNSSQQDWMLKHQKRFLQTQARSVDYQEEIRKAQEKLDRIEEIKTSTRNLQSAYENIQNRTQECQDRDNKIFEKLLSIVTTESARSAESKSGELETNTCLLEAHAISNCKKINQTLFISDALRELEKTITAEVVSLETACKELTQGSSSKLWGALCSLVDSNFNDASSSDEFKLLQSIRPDTIAKQTDQPVPEENILINNYLETFAVLIICQYGKLRELSSLARIFNNKHEVATLEGSLKSIIVNMKDNRHQKAIAICAHATNYIHNNARYEMKSELKRLIPIAAQHIDIPSTEHIKETAKKIIGETLFQVVHDNNPEKEICKQLKDALELYTKPTEPKPTSTAIHKFPFASRLMIQAEKAQDHIQELEKIEDKEKIHGELKAALINRPPNDQTLKMHSQYQSYKSMLRHYHGDMTYFLNSRAVGQTRQTQETMKKHSGKVHVSNTEGNIVDLGSLFPDSNTEIAVADLINYPHYPHLDELLETYESIKKNKPNQEVIQKVNKIHPSIGWELCSMEKNLDSHYNFLHGITARKIAIESSQIEERQRERQLQLNQIETWGFMAQIEQLQIRYSAILEELIKHDKHYVDINAIDLLKNLHTRISRAVLPLIEYQKKPQQSQTSVDFVWETLYKNLHKQFLPNTNQILTNFQGYYEKTMVDQTEEITRIHNLYNLLVTNLEKITNTTCGIDNYTGVSDEPADQLQAEKTKLVRFNNTLSRFVETMMETGFSEQSKIEAFFAMEAMALLSHKRSNESTQTFKIFLQKNILDPSSNWFYQICLTEQYLLTKRHMHTRLRSLCRSKINRSSPAMQKVSMSLQYSEDKNMVIHFSENLDRLLTSTGNPVIIDLGNQDEKQIKINQVKSLEEQCEIIFLPDNLTSTINESQDITEDCSSYIQELVKFIPSGMILHFPKTLPSAIINKILAIANQDSKEKMSISLDSPCRDVDEMMIMVCRAKPAHYKVFYKDSVFEPLFDNPNFQEVMLMNSQQIDEGKSTYKYLAHANRLYSYIDVIIYMICKDIDTIYDMTEGNRRSAAYEIPKEYEYIARLFYRSIFEQNPRDASEIIMQFTRAVEHAIGSMTYKNEPSSINSRDILFFPQGHMGMDIIPKDVLDKAQNVSSPEQHQIKLATRPNEATGDYPLEAYRVNSDSVTNPFTRVKICPFHAGLFKEEPKYHLFYQGLRTGPAADNIIGNKINLLWHTENMKHCLTSEGDHNEPYIRKLKELSYFGVNLSKMSRYDHILTISKMRDLANEIMVDTNRKCTSFFMWPFFEPLSEDIQLKAYRQMKINVDRLCQRKDNSSQIKYAMHLINGWGCKANIVEALMVLTNIIKLTPVENKSDRAKIKTLVFSMLFFRSIVCDKQNDSITKLKVNSAIYEAYYTTQKQHDTEKLVNIVEELNSHGCLDYNEKNLEDMFNEGEQSAGLLLAQIYLAGSFKDKSGQLIRNNQSNLEAAIKILETILEKDDNNHIANLLYGIALRSGKGTHIQPLKSQQRFDKIPTELPTPVESMLHQNLTAWKLGILSYHSIDNTQIKRKELTQEIVDDILENQRFLRLEVENELSLDSRAFDNEAFNNILQVGVLLNISNTSLIMQDMRSKNNKAEKTLTEKYDQIMKNGWDILTRDGERFLLLLKHEPFEERLRQTIYTQSNPITIESKHPKR